MVQGGSDERSREAEGIPRWLGGDGWGVILTSDQGYTEIEPLKLEGNLKHKGMPWKVPKKECRRKYCNGRNSYKDGLGTCPEVFI